jgi:hypothetical protein
MAENNNGGGGTPQNPTNPTAGGSQPTVPNSGTQGTQSFDVSKVTDEQFDELSKDGRFWDRAFKHERFTKLNERAKKADEYEANQSKAEEAKLIEQKKFQELADKKSKEAEDYKGRFEKAQVDNKIITVANGLGVVDPEAVLSLLDRKSIKVTDEGVQGVEAAVKALIELKPYLKGGTPAVPNIGAGSNPAGAGQGQPMKFKHSQLQDPKFYREHEKEIMTAMKLGLIEDDLHGQQ